MNNAMLAKEWREAPLSRTTDLDANARPWPGYWSSPIV